MIRNLKVSQLVLTVLFILLFLAALVCAVVALTKKPDSDSYTASGAAASDKITALQDVKTEVSYTDKKGALSINDVAKKLVTAFIGSVPKKEVAFRIKSVDDVTLAVIDSTMDYSSICKGPLSDDVWFISGKALVTYKGDLLTDSDGYAFIGGRYIVRDGKKYTLYAQDVYENAGQAAAPDDKEPAPGTQEPGTATDTGPAFTWGEYDTSTTISSAEMRLSSGVTLGMAFDDVQKITGDFEKVEDGSGTKTATRGAYTYTFTLISDASTSANDYGLPHDGKYYLTGVTADETCKDEFPRGIKVGDSIENVFTKFPVSGSTKLQEWAQQRLYGAMEFKKNATYAYLEFRTFLQTYRIYAQDTGREAVSIEFDKDNKVNGFEWIYQQ